MTTQYNQCGSLYASNGRRKYLTPLERSHFIAAAEQCERAEIRTLCLTLAYTGCRISEALALTTSSIEIEEAFIAFRTLKKRNGAVAIREVPVPALLLGQLAEVHGLAAAEGGERLWQLSRSQAWRLVKRVMTAANVAAGQHATCRGLRHGYGLHAVRRSVPLNLIQRWLGHASIQTTCLYLQAVGDEEKEFASRLWGKSPGRSA